MKALASAGGRCPFAESHLAFERGPVEGRQNPSFELAKPISLTSLLSEAPLKGHAVLRGASEDASLTSLLSEAPLKDGELCLPPGEVDAVSPRF